MLVDNQFDGKVLGQLRPANTTAVSLYSPNNVTNIARLYGVLVANVTGTDSTFSLFIDNNGTSYDEDTTVGYDLPIKANSVVFFSFSEFPVTLNNSSANFAVESGTADAITFTLYGSEKVIN